MFYQQEREARERREREEQLRREEKKRAEEIYQGLKQEEEEQTDIEEQNRLQIESVWKVQCKILNISAIQIQLSSLNLAIKSSMILYTCTTKHFHKF